MEGRKISIGPESTGAQQRTTSRTGESPFEENATFVCSNNEKAPHVSPRAHAHSDNENPAEEEEKGEWRTVAEWYVGASCRSFLNVVVWPTMRNVGTVVASFSVPRPRTERRVFSAA